MKRALFGLISAAPIAMVLAMAPAAAAETAAAQNDNASSIEIYKAGHDFVVAVYRPDNSAVFSVVEARHVKMERSAGGARSPNLADLVNKGRVKYTMRINPDEMPKVDSIDNASTRPSASGAASATTMKTGAKLTRQQKSFLFAQLRNSRQAMGEVSKSLSDNVGGAEETPSAASKHHGVAHRAKLNR